MSQRIKDFPLHSIQPFVIFVIAYVYKPLLIEPTESS